MKTLTSLRALILTGVLLVAVLVGVHNAAAASTGQIYVTPSSASVQNGSTVTVQVRINPVTGVDGAQFTLNFDPSLLKFSSVDTSASAFTAGLQQTSTASSVTVARGQLSGPVTSDSLIATVTLQGVADSGTSALALSNANATSGGAYTNPTTADGSVSLTAKPITTPPPTGSGGGGTSSGGTTTPTSSTLKTTTTTPTKTTTSAPTSSVPPIVAQSGSDSGVIDSQFTLANISVQTSVPTTMYIKYGLDSSLGLQTPVSSLATTHSVALDSNTLVPGQTYYYQIVLHDAKGNQTATQVKTFATKGFTLRFTVIDRNGHRMSHTKVELHSTPMTVTTDGDGVATFQDVSPGDHHLIYTAGGHQYSQPVTVYNTVTTDATGRQVAAPQNVSVQFAVVKSNSLAKLPIVFGLLVLVIVVFVLLARMRANSQPAWARTATSSAVVMPPVDPGSSVSPQAPIESAHGVDAPHPGSVVTPGEHHDEK